MSDWIRPPSASATRPKEFIGRRTFLKGLLAGLGMVGLTGGIAWRFLGAGGSSSRLPTQTEVLTRSECATLAALIESLMDESGADVLRESVARADALAASFSRQERLELHGALFLAEQVLHGWNGRFSCVTIQERQARLQSWSRSSGIKRDIYVGMKELSALALYTGDSRWREIGYSGPLVSDRSGENRLELLQAGLLGKFWGKGGGESGV
jgi:hypothetical protein